MTATNSTINVSAINNNIINIVNTPSNNSAIDNDMEMVNASQPLNLGNNAQQLAAPISPLVPTSVQHPVLPALAGVYQVSVSGGIPVTGATSTVVFSDTQNAFYGNQAGNGTQAFNGTNFSVPSGSQSAPPASNASRMEMLLELLQFLDAQEREESAEIVEDLKNKYKATNARLLELREIQAAHQMGQRKVSLDTAVPNARSDYRRIVPPDMPQFQLADDIWKPKAQVFESVNHFVKEFERSLNAYKQPFDSEWERLLPLCLNSEQDSWFDETLKGKGYKWVKVVELLVDHYESPFYRFLKMIQ